MNILVFLEHDGTAIRLSSRSALTLAQSVANDTKGNVSGLLLGHNCEVAAQDAATYVPVAVADHADLAYPLSDRWATIIARFVREERIDLLVAASNTTAKDIVARAAGLLGGTMASEVIAYQFQDDRLEFRRPMYAGAVTATVVLLGDPQIVTVRSAAFEPAGHAESSHKIHEIEVSSEELPNHVECAGLDSKQTGRPDVTEANVVVSGGRAFKNSDDFERIVGGLADALQGATGSSRALVDAGITPNELQVGQTGKIVAPELYVALGISGAVQHLAGMKNSKVVVAINNDPDAPIFEVADYGLVGDVYEVVPELIEKLSAS